MNQGNILPVYSFSEPPQHFDEVIPTVWKIKLQWHKMCFESSSFRFIWHNSTTYNVNRDLASYMVIAIKIKIELDGIASRDEILKVSSSTISEF